MRRLVREPVLRASLGEAARKRAVNEFAMADTARRVMAVYTRAIRTPRAAPGTPAAAALP
jgi:hypothetical protein